MTKRRFLALLISFSMLVAILIAPAAYAADAWAGIQNTFQIPCVTDAGASYYDTSLHLLGTLPAGVSFLAQGSRETNGVRYILVQYQNRSVYIKSSVLAPTSKTPSDTINGSQISGAYNPEVRSSVSDKPSSKLIKPESATPGGGSGTTPTTPGEGDGTAPTTPDEEPEPPYTGYVDNLPNLEERNAVLSIVSQERTAEGQSPLQAAHAFATEIAMLRAQQIATEGNFKHEPPEGKDSFSTMLINALKKEGYQWTSYGENIAAGRSDAATTMDDWMHSEGHKNNILNGGYTYVAVGYAEVPGSKYNYYWVQIFYSVYE